MTKDPIVETLTESEKYPQHIQAIPGNTDEVWYNIPELNIRMRLNKDFAEDLIYRYFHEKDDEGKEWDSAGFSTKALISITEYCGPGAVWSLDRITAVLKEEIEKSDVPGWHFNDYVRVGNYYYGLEGSHDVCWDPGLEQKVREVFPRKYNGTGAKDISDGVKTIELIPQK